MDVWIKELFMNLLLGILKILDSIMSMFQKLVGIETVRLGDGQDTSLTEFFLQNDAVTNVFWAIFIISLSICAVCVIVAVIKSIINAKGGENKAHSKTVFQGVASIVVTIVMAGIMVAGIGMSNTILQKIDLAFKSEEAMPVAVTIFDISVEDGYEQDLDAMQKIKEHQLKMVDEGTSIEDVPCEIKDKDGKVIATYNKEIWDNNYKVWLYSVNKISTSGYESGKSKANFLDAKGLFNDKLNASDVMGTYKKNFGFPDSDNPHHNGIIKPDSFNMVFAFFMALTLIVVIAISMLGLVKRLYDLVILFLSLPLVVSLLPLDDGAHFKIWRETVVSKVVLAYGCIIAVNVFILLCPVILGMAPVSFADKLLQAFLLVGGALAINGGQLLFARLMGTSAEEFRDMTNSARALTGGVLGTVGALKGGASLLLGAKNANGQRAGGLLKGALTVAKGAGNLAGNMLGGNAYRAGASAVASKAGSAANALRGATGLYKKDQYGGDILPPDSGKNSFMESNGFLGNAIRAAKGDDKPRMLDGSAMKNSVAKIINSSKLDNTLNKVKGGKK